MKQFRIEAEKCSACQLCVIACKDEHVGVAHSPWTAPQPETGQFWIAVHEAEHGRAPRLRTSRLPVMCQHCTNAACMKVCAPAAIRRRPDGLVWIDPASCTGCGLCEPACPYDAIAMNAALGVAQKCTGCAHLVDEGLPPRCVEVCPHDVIVFGEDVAREAETLHPEFLARPLVGWTGLPRPSLAGCVIDAAAEMVVVDAWVTATDLFADHTTTARSDAFGAFRLDGLQNGRKYQVTIGTPDYRTVIRIVTLAAGDEDLGEVVLCPA